MKIHRALLGTILVSALAGAAACSQSSSNHAQGDHSVLGDAIADAMDEARQKLRTANIDISSGHVGFSTGHTSGRNRAEITPQGDLLIDGKAVAITPQQRTMLLQYRAQVIDIAEQGMQIGTQGVDLASHAVSTALGAAFSGKPPQQIHQQLENEAAGIRQSAAKLCGQLPALMESQQKLAASLPAFRPYATMTQDDIDRCRRDATRHDHADFSASN